MLRLSRFKGFQQLSQVKDASVLLRASSRTVHLESLNAAQTEAVVASPAYPLQILAGPGTGKTRVLTSRIVQLIEHHNFKPESICAVTFTKRAASEMEIRLHAMLGGDVASRLTIGTFHSVCFRYLRRYSREAGLPQGFQVIDEFDRFRLLNNIMLKSHAKIIAINEGRRFPATQEILNAISACKMSGDVPAKGSVLELVYLDYQKEMARRNKLDFDDLLIYTVRLFKRYPKLTRNIKHILIDEFQDTNNIQYELARQFVDSNRTITVVGDPDQSIYAWRSAVKEIMESAFEELPGCSRVLLEENYRSTGHIVAASDGIISQDEHRIDKHLWTKNPRGKLVFTKQFDRANDENYFIAKEILRLKTGYGLEFSDFAILVRYNAQSRAIEEALTNLNVPCRVLNDERYYYRPQVRAIVAYLRLIDDETEESAFRHVFEVMGSNSSLPMTDKIVKLAESYRVPSMTYLRGPKSELTPFQRSLVTSFLQDLDELRTLSHEGLTISQLIDHVVTVVRPENIWDNSPDHIMNWKNVVELKTFANAFQQARTERRPPKRNSRAPCSGLLTPFLLKTFPNEVEEDGTQQISEVVISTVHKAKGSEWPVVFIPSVEVGVFPPRTAIREAADEERRVFFVATTRAQALLYLTHSQFRGKSKCLPSPFLVEALDNQETLYTNRYPVIMPESRIAMHKLLRRDPPDVEETERNIVMLNIPLNPTDDYYLNPASKKSMHSQRPISPAPPLKPNTARYNADLMEFTSERELIKWFLLSRFT